MDIAVTITFVVLLFCGIVITAIPTLPGMLFMLIVTLIYAIIDNFETVQPQHFYIFGGLVAAAILSDYISGLIGAKFGGASKKSILFGIIGMFLGFLLFPPFGLFLGLFAGIFISEIVQYQDHRKAFKAASYSMVGTIAGMITNVLLAIAFFVTFLVIVF